MRSDNLMNMYEISREIGERLHNVFFKNDKVCDQYTEERQNSRKANNGKTTLFYEYFHGDNGAGLGASHQTGWTGVVAKIIQLYGMLDPNKALNLGKNAAFVAEPIEA